LRQRRNRIDVFELLNDQLASVQQEVPLERAEEDRWLNQHGQEAKHIRNWERVFFR